MAEARIAATQVCFVDMPFGKKVDPGSGVEVDFDQIYEKGIEPAIAAAGLECIRGDREETGGIIHAAMFARLLVSEFVIADLTSANPNVFYELGVRHTAKPYTTIPIFATISAIPFDVGLVRAIPYNLSDGRLLPDSARALQETITTRIRRVLEGPVTKDSPLFQLFDKFPGIEMSHELTDVFRDRVRYSKDFKNRLGEARAAGSHEEALSQLKSLEEQLGDLKSVERGVLVDLFLSYRAVEAWDAMIALQEEMPADVADAIMVQQQLAFALNRRAGAGDAERALAILNGLVAEFGDSAETFGLLGRVYKDRYKKAEETDDPAAGGYLDLAIGAYTRGFEVEPADYYPGINALTLLLKKGTGDAGSEIDRLAPLVTFAAVRRGGAEAKDYWTVATILELSLINRDFELANRVLPRVLALADESWMLKTTAGNLELLAGLRGGEEGGSEIGRITKKLLEAAAGIEKS